MEPVGPASAGIAVSLMLAAAVALLIYSRKGKELEPPVVVAADTVPAREPERAFPLVVAHPGAPFVTFTEFSPSPFRLIGTAAFHFKKKVPLGTWANLPH